MGNLAEAGSAPGSGGGSGAGGEVMVGLVDKRGEEYDPGKHAQQGRSAAADGVDLKVFREKGSGCRPLLPRHPRRGSSSHPTPAFHKHLMNRNPAPPLLFVC